MQKQKSVHVHSQSGQSGEKSGVMKARLTARNNPTETPSAKVTIFRNITTQLPIKPFCNFQGVIL